MRKSKGVKFRVDPVHKMSPKRINMIQYCKINLSSKVMDKFPLFRRLEPISWLRLNFDYIESHKSIHWFENLEFFVHLHLPFCCESGKFLRENRTGNWWDFYQNWTELNWNRMLARMMNLKWILDKVSINQSAWRRCDIRDVGGLPDPISYFWDSSNWILNCCHQFRWPQIWDMRYEIWDYKGIAQSLNWVQIVYKWKPKLKLPMD